MDFDELVEKAAGYQPYPYQRRLALEGYPDVLAVPTGAGKTLAAVLPWLWRRRFHSDADVRASTPRWLVLVLPMRVLVEQSHEAIEGWLEALGLSDEVSVHRVMGGEPKHDDWRLHPHHDTVFVGTVDMLLSRALNRGYGASRWSWPIDFGLFNNGCQWVFDEVQLLGPALPASRQLEGLRRKLGGAQPCHTMWMSATVREESLVTVDLPEIGVVHKIEEVDRTGPLATRLAAEKRVERLADLDPTDLHQLADRVLTEHQPGTRTIVVLNTVDRATELYRALKRPEGPETVLVHSRFRPPDRRRAVERAITEVDPNGPGTIVVTTQVLEAGVDVTSHTLITEAASWPSIVQRAGRCNRDGLDGGARLRWFEPPRPVPYEPDDVAMAIVQLDSLEGQSVTPDSLSRIEVASTQPFFTVPRRRDLIELFDTLPDLSGNDIDVSRFIRDAQDLDVEVAWIDSPGSNPGEKPDLDPDLRPPLAEERCSVPVSVLRDRSRGLGSRRAWRFDHIAEAWVPVTAAELRPGMLVLLDREEGGYTEEYGWDAKSKTTVDPVHTASEGRDPEPLSVADAATGADPLTVERGRWQALAPHLADVEHEVRELAGAFGALDLSDAALEAAAVAGRLHDIGKAHRVFQEMLESTIADDQERAAAEAAGAPWAKSAGTKRGTRSRKHFRHELASALALLGEGRGALDGVEEGDLVVYLVAAHHGRIRLGFRSLPDETPPPDGRVVALGVWDGDRLPAVITPNGQIPESVLRLDSMALGDRDGVPSWTARATALRDREDIGPFRLAFLEALVRLADWRASARFDSDEGEGGDA